MFVSLNSTNMTLDEAKEQFIQTWGGLATNWGINKTMAQVHALLLVSDELLSADDVMEKLHISRGNVNINMRELINWGLVSRASIKGERREFFQAEKDIWKVATRIASERRKREVEPILKALSNVKQIDTTKENKAEVQRFQEFIGSLEDFTASVDGAFDKLVKADQNWFTSTLLKLMR
jgi:DNA-binding transcriptional regulator GbsR (MarR family)